MAELAIQVKVDAGGAISVLDATGKKIGEVQTRAEQSTGAFNVLGRAWTSIAGTALGLNQALDLVGKAFTAVRTVASGAATVLEQFITASARADELGDLAQKIGVNAQLIAEFSVALETSGASQEAFAVGVRQLSRAAVEAASGAEQQKDAFKQLGVEIRDSSGALKPTESLIYDVADALSQMEDGTLKTALSQEVLGRSGAELIPTLNAGREGLKAYAEEARALGVVYSGQLLEASDRFQDNLVKLQIAGRGVQTQLAEGFVPVVADLSDRLVALVKNLDLGGGRLATLGEAAGRVVNAIVSSFGGLDSVTDKVNGLLDTITSALNVFAGRVETVGLGPALLQSLEDARPALVEIAKDIGVAIGQVMGETAKGIMTTSFQDVTFADGIQAAVGTAVGLSLGRVFKEPITGAALGASMGPLMTQAFQAMPTSVGATLGAVLGGQAASILGSELVAKLTGFSFGAALGPVGVIIGTALGAVAGPIVANLIIDDLARIDTALRATLGQIAAVKVDTRPVVQGAQDAIEAVEHVLAQSGTTIERGLVRNLESARGTIDAQADVLKQRISEAVKLPAFASDPAFRKGVEDASASLNVLQNAGSQVDAALDKVGQSGRKVVGPLEQAAAAAGRAGSRITDTGGAAGKAADQLGQLAAQQTAAVDASERYRAAVSRISSGQTTLVATTAQVAAATAGYAADAKKAEVAAAALAAEQAKIVAAFNQATASLADQNVTARAVADAWQEAVDAGDTMEDGQRRVAEAALEVQLQQAALNGVNAEDIELRRQQAIAALDYADAARTAQAALQGNQDIAKLQEQLSITQQIRDGTLATVEGERALAVAAAGTDKILRDQAARKFDLQKAIEDTSAGMIRLGATIKDSLGQVFDALISGTLDLGDTMRSLGLAIGKRWVEGMLDAKLKDFDPAVNANFLDLAASGKSIFGNMFNGVVSLFSGGGGGGGFVGPLLENGTQGSLGNAGLFGFGGNSTLGLLASFLGGGGGSALGGAFGSDALSIGSSAFSLANTGVALLTNGFQAGGGIVSALFGSGAASSTLGSMLGTTGSGLITNLFGQAGTNVLSTSLGTLGTVAGGVGSVVGGGYSAFNLAQGDFSAANILGLVAATASAINFLPVVGQIIYAIAVIGAAIAGLVTDITPTKGTLQRRFGESVLDQTDTFAGLQDVYGDLTRKKNNLGANPALPSQREHIGAEGIRDITGFAAIFAEAAFGDTENGTFVAQMAFQWTNILTDFFSRMEGESAEVSAAIRGHLLSAFKDLGISDASKAFEQLNDAAAHFIYPPGNFDYLEEQVDSVGLLGAAIRGVGSIFESELPAGVHIAALALESMKNEGNAAFTELDTVGRETLLNLSKDSENFDAIVGKLFRDGFKIDTEEFKTRLGDITASAQFVGDNIGALFSGGSVVDGINAMGAKLKETILGAVNEAGLKDLFDNTNIAASFEPVFAVLRQLKAGDYEGGVGSDAFQTDIVAAIVEGKATLSDYLPELRAIRDATMEVQEAIDEALKPTDVEQFWMNMADVFKANQDAVEGMAASLAGVVIDAERLREGGGQDAARAAVGQSIDATIFDATKEGAAAAASESPAGKELARLTTEFQFKVAAALKDGVITGSEAADLNSLKAKMHEAGEVLADGIAAGTEQLNALFRVDRLREAIQAAVGTLKGATGTAAGSMFDVIKGGGSTAEGIEAFGESFRSSVRDNVLQGMQEALVQSVVMEGALSTLMGQLKQAVSVALEDGYISADEQKFIDGLAKGIGTATDATLAALQPTLETLGGVAQTVAGNSEKAEAKVGDLDRSTKNASYGVDEMARRAARNLEGVGDAVPPAVTGAIKEGIGALGDALGDGAGGGPAEAIKDGLGALADAVGGGAQGGAATTISDGLTALKDAIGDGASGSSADIRDGLTKLRDAFGPNVGADEMKATLEKLRGAFGTEFSDPIQQGIGRLRDAIGAGGQADGLITATEQFSLSLGGPGAGLTGVADQLAAALGEAGGVTGVAGELAGALQDELGGATDDVAGRLRGGFTDGLGSAEIAARKLAEALNGIQVPGAATGGSFAGGAAVVGEAGEPELVVARAGGGFDVIPIDKATASALMGGGVPGFEDGGTIIGPGGGVNPTRGPDLIGIAPRNTGPFGRPRVPPPPAPPRTPAGPQDGVEIPVILDLQSALGTLASTGDLDKLAEVFSQSTGQGVIDGITRGLLESGPIKEALDDFNKQMNAAVEDAVKDGVVSAREASDLADLAEKLGGPIQDQLEALGPAFDLIAERFGLRTVEEVAKAGEGIRTILGSAIQSAFQQGATFEQFTASLAQQTFNAMSSAIVDSFIQGALAEGALGVVMDNINATIKEMADGSLKQAEGAARLLGYAAEAAGILKSDELKAAFTGVNAIIDEIAKSLNVTRQTTQAVARDIPAAVSTLDAAQEKACDGQCDVKKELAVTELGFAQLDRFGRGASVSVEQFLKPGEKSIFAPSTATSSSNDAEVRKLLQEIAKKTGSDVQVIASALEEYAKGVRGQKLTMTINGREVAEGTFEEMEDQSRAGRRFYINVGEIG